jgi:hypothetical protein
MIGGNMTSTPDLETYAVKPETSRFPPLGLRFGQETPDSAFID